MSAAWSKIPFCVPSKRVRGKIPLTSASSADAGGGCPVACAQRTLRTGQIICSCLVAQAKPGTSKAGVPQLLSSSPELRRAPLIPSGPQCRPEFSTFRILPPSKRRVRGLPGKPAAPYKDFLGRPAAATSGRDHTSLSLSATGSASGTGSVLGVRFQVPLAPKTVLRIDGALHMLT